MIGSGILARRACAMGLLSLLVVVVAITLGFGIGQALAETPKAAQGAGQTAAVTEAPAAAPAAAQAEDAEAAEATEETEAAEPAEDPAFTAAVAQKLRQAVVAQRTEGRMRSTTQAQREAAARNLKSALAGGGKAGSIRSARGGTLDSGAPRNAVGAAVNYFEVPNWALSPTIKKFVDSLPGLGSAAASTLGTNIFIPVAKAIAPASLPPGVPNDADYYELQVGEYTYNMYSGATPNSPPATTKLRGYKDLNPLSPDGNNYHYLGPVIIADKDRPVRLKVTNNLPQDSVSPFFIPVDRSYMGAGTGPLGGYYTNNRTDVHLHGGLTPWISDGTPHQWFVPAVEPPSTVYRKGLSFYNVPDMPSPAEGVGTYYWTNAQSSRLMFYHDHAYGITRLNVYAGIAAGYVLVDPWEKSMINGTAYLGFNAGGLKVLPDLSDLNPYYKYGIPLIIQDKTFVPSPADVARLDPTWDTTNWGGQGNLWFPHVYMPNQNPADNSGANAFGRWDWGPWFWPPQRTLTVDPAAGNGVPVGTPPQGTPEGHAGCAVSAAGLVAWPNLTCPWTPNPSGVPEAFMDTPLVNGLAYPYLPVQQRVYRFRILNAANDRMMNLQIYYAADAAGNVCNGTGDPTLCTEVKMVTAAPHPTVAPAIPEVPADADDSLVCGSVGALAPPACWPAKWPTDGRDGGVPDPTTVGPSMIQIGHEGGFLPAPVTLPNQPVGYNYNRRDIVVLNVQDTTLFLAPAERGDVLVDFSAVPANSTLILYNDAPAPVPAFDSRIDYYTGDPDQTSTGGAPTTLAGYGPNTRTVMQFRVTGPSTGAAFALNTTNLTTLMQAAFTASQPPIIVPQVAYGFATDTFARIQDTQLSWPNPLGPPGAMITYDMKWKAIHELFTTDYGRMNSLLGVELPLTNWLTQTTIPLSYIDPPTETFNENETQIWKITHNGVDSHGVHFHLFNVQLVNRVGWDGAIRPPAPNELGWKDTVRMNPLEDVMVAIKPATPPVTAFAVPDSVRPLDTTRAVGTTGQFTGIDPVTNNPITVTNQLTNFHWEYVWHCHLLGHEESDMMRPLVLNVVPPVPPAAPNALTAVATGNTQVTLTWAYTAGTTAGTGFRIERATGLGGYVAIGTLVGTGVLTYPDNTIATNITYTYRVITTGTLVNSLPSNTATITVLRMPTALRTLSRGTTQVIINWTAPVPNTGVTGYVVRRALASAPTTWTTVGTLVGVTATTFRNTGLVHNTAYLYQVQSVGAGGAASAFTASLAVTTLP